MYCFAKTWPIYKFRTILNTWNHSTSNLLKEFWCKTSRLALENHAKYIFLPFNFTTFKKTPKLFCYYIGENGRVGKSMIRFYCCFILKYGEKPHGSILKQDEGFWCLIVGLYMHFKEIFTGKNMLRVQNCIEKCPKNCSRSDFYQLKKF